MSSCQGSHLRDITTIVAEPPGLLRTPGPASASTSRGERPSVYHLAGLPARWPLPPSPVSHPRLLSQAVDKSALGFLWAAAPGRQEKPSEGHARRGASRSEDEKAAQEVLEDEAAPCMAVHREEQQIPQNGDADRCSSEEARVFRSASKERRSAAQGPFKMLGYQFFPRLDSKLVEQS